MTGSQSLLVCDLTQSYSPYGGGGIGVYLAEKRRYVLEQTDHRLLQIVPGPEDRIIEDGRTIWCEIGAEPVRGSPNYRFIMRKDKVREVLARYRPDVVESMCPWVLPWVAIRHRRAFPETALVAGYHTDFPDAHVYRVASGLMGHHPGRFFRFLSCCYGEITYREFDKVYSVGAAALPVLEQMKVAAEVLPLGVDTRLFHPDRADPDFRRELGLSQRGPLLVYSGRLDNEKSADVLVEMFRLLPVELDAAMVLIGHGKLAEELKARAAGLPVVFTGFIEDRATLARTLASSDIYVSAMASETFGVSVIEAQACGLPVVGVAGGEMVTRVPPATGLLGPVGDPAAMAANVMALWGQEGQGAWRAAGRAGRQLVESRYEWSATFQHLFGAIYPAALAKARARVARGPVLMPMTRLLRGTA
ncbi:MAG TPA: glycosyltransferase [Qipengyuania sp.]|nr:glycosyltransferase [Qipengyuania sp.]